MSHQQKPDILIPVIILFVLVVFIFYLPPVYTVMKGIQCYLLAFEALITFKLDTAKKLFTLANELISNYMYIAKHYTRIEINSIVSSVASTIKIRLFLLNSMVLGFASYKLFQSSRIISFHNKKMSLKNYLKLKYGFVPPKPDEPIESVYKRMHSIKKKRNLPVNLVARLYPKESRERIYLYTGSKNVKIIKMEFQKTLALYQKLAQQFDAKRIPDELQS